MNKKHLATCLVLAMMGTTVLSACSKNEVADTENVLQIYCLEQGYGSDWLRNTIAAFKQQPWVKEKYPNLEIVNPTFNDTVSFAANQLALGEKDNSYDILFGAGSMEGYYGTPDLVDLTNVVYNAEVPGEEDITYSEKLNDSLEAGLAYVDDDGETSYYSVPYYSGVYGFIYNEEALKSYNLEVPRTTNEFFAACQTITNANKDKGETKQYAFIQSKDAPYWQKEGSVMEAWWAQYEGLEGYDNFFNGRDELGALSVNIFKQQGRLESLKVMEALLKYENGFMHPQSFSKEYMIMQQSFLRGNAVFHYNGDYFIDEMKEIMDNIESRGDTVPTVKMMKTPIISSIKNKCTTIENDAELSALVKAIDAKSSSLKGDGYDVNQKDFDKVKEARSIVNSVGPAPGVIPSYSKAKDVAIDFLRFMATDIALVEYAKGSNGSTLDFFFDLKTANPEVYEKLAPLHKDRIAYMNDETQPVNILKKGSTYMLCAVGGVKPFADEKYYSVLSGQNNTKTAQMFYDETIGQWDETSWAMALSKAGLK